MVQHKKRILYTPGIISLLLLPLFTWIYLYKNYISTDINNHAITLKVKYDYDDLSIQNSEKIEVNSINQILYLKINNVNDIDLFLPDSINKLLKNFSALEIKNFYLDIQLAENSNYSTFIEVLDLCLQNKLCFKLRGNRILASKLICEEEKSMRLIDSLTLSYNSKYELIHCIPKVKKEELKQNELLNNLKLYSISGALLVIMILLTIKKNLRKEKFEYRLDKDKNL